MQILRFCVFDQFREAVVLDMYFLDLYDYVIN